MSSSTGHVLPAAEIFRTHRAGRGGGSARPPRAGSREATFVTRPSVRAARTPLGSRTIAAPANWSSSELDVRRARPLAASRRTLGSEATGPRRRRSARSFAPVRRRGRLHSGVVPSDKERHVRAAPWLILPVVICLSQRLSHACLSTSHIKVKPRKAH